jgi:hypothetical protein
LLFWLYLFVLCLCNWSFVTKIKNQIELLLCSLYVTWFQCYKTSLYSFVRISGKSSSSYSVLSGVQKGSTLGPLYSEFLFTTFVPKFSITNVFHLPMIWKHIEIYSLLKIVNLFKVLLTRKNSGVVKTTWNVTFRKQKLYLSYGTPTESILITVSDVSIYWRTDCIRHLAVMLDSRHALHFHCNVDYVHSQALRTLWLIRYITYNSSSSDILVVLYDALVRSKLEYA